MVLEEPNQVCSNGSNSGAVSGGGGGDGVNDGCGGGSSSNRSSVKKQKQKKVPQRGLGVAQLEKIRIEEQQKRETAANPFLSHSPSVVSPTDSTSLPVSLLNYPPPPPIPPPVPSQSHSSSPAIHLVPPLPQTNVFSANSIYRQATPSPPPLPPSLQNISNHYHLNSVPPPPPFNPANGGGFDPSLLPLPGNDTNNPRMSWNPWEFNHEGRDSSRWDYQGLLPFMPNISLPFDTSHHIASFPDNLMPRTNQHYQHPPSLVNVPSMSSMSSSSSAVQTYQPVEPPSNQNYFASTRTLPWPEEEKRAAAVKRPYPFSVENPHPAAVAAFQARLPLIGRLPISPYENSNSCGNNVGTHTEHHVPIFREAPPFPSGMLEPVSNKSSSSSSNKDNGIPNADFLTLGPPPSCITPSSISKEYVAANDRNFCNFESFPYQGNGDNHTGGHSGASSSTQQPPYFDFIPTAKGQVMTTATKDSRKNNGSGEGEDSLDLKLKL